MIILLETKMKKYIMTNTIFDWLFAFEKSVFLRKHFQIKKCKEKLSLMWLSAVPYSALFYSALSCTVLCFTQRCLVQCSALLSAVPVMLGFFSVLSRTVFSFTLALSTQRTVQLYFALSRTGKRDVWITGKKNLTYTGQAVHPRDSVKS